jgi:hypothetical protein
MGITQQIGASSLIKPGVIDNTAARPASPYEGQVIFQKDTDQLLVWNGTAWVIPNSPAQNPQGLELVTTATCSSGGTASGGVITIGSAVSSVVVANAFSSLYDNYKIFISGVSLAGSGNSWFIKLANATSTSNKYVGDFMDFSSNTKFPLASTAAADGVWMGVTGGLSSAAVEITNPFNAKTKTFYGQSSGSTYGNEFRGYDGNAVSSGGFTFTQSSTTMTGGTICVYGYRNS